MNELSPILIQGRQETEINLCLAGAQLAKGENQYHRSEKLYLKALKWARERWGRYNPNVGLIVLELQDLYEITGEETKSAALDPEIHATIRRCFFALAAAAANINQKEKEENNDV